MTGAHTRPLDDLRGCDEPSFGGKSAGLGELLGAGIPVPPGFAVATSALGELLREADLEQLVERELAAADSDRIDSVQSASRTIGDCDPLGAAARRARRRARRALPRARARARGGATGDEGPPVAVRSSAVGEDSRDATFAGQQATRLWVRGADQLLAAVRDCWASLYSTPAITYRAKLAEGRPPAMGVAVQLMVDAAVSGVMFTCNPVSGDPSMVAINASWGLGSAVVEGEVTPDDYLLSKVTGEIVRERISAKRVQCVPRDDGHGTELVDVPAAAARAAVPRSRRARGAGRARGPGAAPLRLPSGHRVGDRAVGGAARQPGGRPVAPRDRRRRAASGRAAAQQSALSMVMSTFGVRRPDDQRERS